MHRAPGRDSRNQDVMASRVSAIHMGDGRPENKLFTCSVLVNK